MAKKSGRRAVAQKQKVSGEDAEPQAPGDQGLDPGQRLTIADMLELAENRRGMYITNLPASEFWLGVSEIARRLDVIAANTNRA